MTENTLGSGFRSNIREIHFSSQVEQSSKLLSLLGETDLSRSDAFNKKIENIPASHAISLIDALIAIQMQDATRQLQQVIMFDAFPPNTQQAEINSNPLQIQSSTDDFNPLATRMPSFYEKNNDQVKLADVSQFMEKYLVTRSQHHQILCTTNAQAQVELLTDITNKVVETCKKDEKPHPGLELAHGLLKIQTELLHLEMSLFKIHYLLLFLQAKKAQETSEKDLRLLETTIIKMKKFFLSDFKNISSKTFTEFEGLHDEYQDWYDYAQIQQLQSRLKQCLEFFQKNEDMFSQERNPKKFFNMHITKQANDEIISMSEDEFQALPVIIDHLEQTALNLIKVSVAQIQNHS
jgi:hypothetical protein